MFRRRRSLRAPWWAAHSSPSGVLPGWAAQFDFEEGGRYMADGVPKTFAGAITFTRASVGTRFDSDSVLQTDAIGVARFDHDPLTGVRLGLLGEDERLNKLTRHSEFDHADWTKTTATAVSVGGDVYEITFDSGQTGFIRQSSSATGVISASYEVKQVDVVDVDLRLGNTGNVERIRFNFSTGLFSLIGSSIDSEIAQQLKDGWWRITVTGTSADPASVTLASGLSPADEKVLIRRFQYEEGAFPSSFIPGDAVTTRNADIIALVADGSLPHPGYNQTENTIAGKLTLTDVTTEQVIVSYNDGTTDNRVELFVVSGDLKARVIVATVAKASITLGSVTAATNFTFALSWIANALRGSVDGATEVNDTASNTIPSASQCDVFSQLGTTSLVGQGHFNYLRQYPTAFSGATLEGIA